MTKLARTTKSMPTATVRSLRDAADLKPDTPVQISAGVLADIARRLAIIEDIEDAADSALLKRILDQDAEAEAWPDSVMERLLNDEHPMKVIREWRGLTQTQLARAAKLSQSSIAEMERGKAASVAALRRVAMALNVGLDDLLAA